MWGGPDSGSNSDSDSNPDPGVRVGTADAAPTASASHSLCPACSSGFFWGSTLAGGRKHRSCASSSLNPARQWRGSFSPSSGVGPGARSEAAITATAAAWLGWGWRQQMLHAPFLDLKQGPNRSQSCKGNVSGNGRRGGSQGVGQSDRGVGAQECRHCGEGRHCQGR